MSKLDLEEGERFQRVFVLPLVEAVRAEVKPLVDRQAKHDERLDKLESNQKKAIAGFGAIAAIVAAVSGTAVDWIKRKAGL